MYPMRLSKDTRARCPCLPALEVWNHATHEHYAASKPRSIKEGQRSKAVGLMPHQRLRIELGEYRRRRRREDTDSYASTFHKLPKAFRRYWCWLMMPYNRNPSFRELLRKASQSDLRIEESRQHTALISLQRTHLAQHILKVWCWLIPYYDNAVRCVEF